MSNPDQMDTNVKPLTDVEAPATTETKMGLGGSEPSTFDQIMGLALRETLSEIMGYKELIDTAKTQAKKDFYGRKIKKATKRLQRMLPEVTAK